MILELDCGNSLIKWRLINGEHNEVICSGTAFGEEDLISHIDQVAAPTSIKKARVVSVRTEAQTTSLLGALRMKYSMPVLLAKSTKSLAGVTNGYYEPEFLGTDRWLAIVAAFLHTGRASLVLDIGTAVTADFVSFDGAHLGGFICPGIKLMREQLGANTGRIGFVSAANARGNRPGRQTTEAVERGTELMLLGFVGTQMKMAHDFWKDKYSIVVTGGDASMVKAHFSEAIIVPDLVFRGLALACPD